MRASSCESTLPEDGYGGGKGGSYGGYSAPIGGASSFDPNSVSRVCVDLEILIWRVSKECLGDRRQHRYR